ncbi:TPA: hypothetical protein DCX24_10985 [Candidatus Azambacteria bacterium]|nr:hypothetical protein [Rheinheimera sp.]HAW93190.1 hypothetical protein [Candidatus Azambacteria bacterium]
MTMPRGQPNQHSSSSWLVFLAHLLFILAVWTLFIKYLFPMAYALVYDESLMRYVYWDFWPLAHIWLGWALLARPPYTRALAIGMAVIEIAIICTLLGRFLADPEWSIWRTNWFVNKVFVLTCFALVLGTALRRPDKM